MGGSGGGGGSYFTAKDVEQLRRDARDRLERNRLDAEVNSLLQRQLVDINDRDIDRVNRRLDQIEGTIQQDVKEIDRLIFGGSVAKHTYVDGLSDIDSLIVLRDETLSARTPAEVREQFRDTLLRQLPQGDVASITAGRMAVTITYRDGTVIQLLPAVQSGGEVSIPSPDGSSWFRIRPRLFAQELSKANGLQGGAVVPTIKLAKAILANKLGDESPSGYHVEALAVAAFQDYAGPRTPKAMLTRFLERASEDVCRPIPDITGQSRYVDEALGPPNSPARRALCRVFRDLSKVTESSRSVAEWRALFD